MKKYAVLILTIVSMFVSGCNSLGFSPAGEDASSKINGYTAASSITSNGFAKDAEQMRALDDQVVKFWGYVDHGNMYGDESAKAILGNWWGGDGPDESTWRFHLKANADDATGESFAINVDNDPGRDELLRAFVADAEAGRPTKVFIIGRLITFDAPSNNLARVGLMLEVQSSRDVFEE